MENGERKVHKMGFDALTRQIGVTQLNDRKQPTIKHKVGCLRGSSAGAEKDQHIRILSAAILGFYLIHLPG